MEQQDNSAASGPRPPDAAPPERSPDARDPAADRNWGQGSATALENLRRHNFRGKRSLPDDERPR